MTISRCSPKGLSALAREWDGLAEERHRQLSSHQDLSFDYVTVPTAFRLLDQADRSVVLDIGAGTGDFTALLAERAREVIAIEPSPSSMAVARAVCKSAANVIHVEASLEESVELLDTGRATAAVALMTLMTVPDISTFVKSLARLLKPRSAFIAVLTHPCFWPRYWGYDREPWFRYRDEQFIEAPFTISRCKTNFVTTHVHRPLEQYMDTFSRQGFLADCILEPMPDPALQSLYPKPWDFPRFLGVRWQRSS